MVGYHELYLSGFYSQRLCQFDWGRGGIGGGEGMNVSGNLGLGGLDGSVSHT